MDSNWKNLILQQISAYLWNTQKYSDIQGEEFVVPVSGAVIDPDDITTIIDAALDGWFTEGQWAKKFVLEIKRATGARYVVLCNSGSSASLLAITAASILYGKQGKVLTCAVGFPTTVTPIFQSNLIPVFLDIEPNSFNVSLRLLQDKIENGKDKDEIIGAIFTHTLGFAFDESLVRLILGDERFLVVDCCDALGANLKQYPIKVGYFGDFATYSFFPAHHITSGEGGAVTTNNPDAFRVLQSLANWGRDCWCLPGKDNTCGKRFKHKFDSLPEGWDHKYTFTNLGYNLKMTELQAALGYSQIQKLHMFIMARMGNYNYIFDNLFLSTNEYLKLYPIVDHHDSPFGFPITVGTKYFTRKEMVEYLESSGIRTRPIFAGNLARQPMVKDRYYECYPPELPFSNFIMENSFWIGCHPGLTTKQLDYAISTIEKFVRSKTK